jgi:2-oxoisovalerate dehydrogenase E1 component
MSTLDRASVVDDNFIQRVTSGELPVPRAGFSQLNINHNQLLSWFDSQIKSRLLDIVARRLKERGQSFYTIGSSGHEGNAVIADVFSLKDMAFLHYRSGAFFIERAKKNSKIDGVDEILLSLVASSDDKISRGRHKVLGSLPLNIPPQTSTIASHLPKALGTAISLTRAKELNIKSVLAKDSVVLCSFGDASLNHASTQTTLNACSWLSKQSYPLPLVLICEDNGLGISVSTPKNWVKETVQDRIGLHYIACDGLDVVDTYQAAIKANYLAREKKEAVFLHMSCSRILGHAGSDIETQYLPLKTIRENESQDPLLYTAHILLHHGLLSKDKIISLYLNTKKNIEEKASESVNRPKLESSEAIMASIVPREKKKVSFLPLNESKRKALFAEKYNQLSLKRTLQQQINFALTDILAQYPQTVVFGEDVGKKGGVYRVTADLQKTFGIRRVFDTLLDETTILGTAIGFAHNGFLPIPEIQFLAYLHNAEDQIRGEAATLSFFSDGQYQNPMVIRIASLAYQKGFGGHFHNDNSIAVLRDIPGLIVACPSNGPDAAKMLRTCVKLAYQEGRVVVFLEPIALYMTKDLHDEKDEKWLFPYPAPSESIEYQEVGTYGQGEMVILTYGNGYYLSRQAHHILKNTHDIEVKVVDIRWLSPLPIDEIIDVVLGSTHILIVDEGRRTGSLSETLLTLLFERLSKLPVIERLTGEDTFIPLGRAWEFVLPSQEKIVAQILKMKAGKAFPETEKSSPA